MPETDWEECRNCPYPYESETCTNLACYGMRREAEEKMKVERPLNLTERYKAEIERFFREADFSIIDRVKGHVWIAGRGRSFQALTVEPPEGGQYEIAVRFPIDADHVQAYDKYSGYIAFDGYLWGRNTDGH